MTELEALLNELDQQQALMQVRESALRRFAGLHPHDYRAWHSLFSILVANENWRELVRLAEQTARRFPNEKEPGFMATIGLANLQRIDTALARITPKNGQIESTAAQMALRGSLMLVRQPASAKIVFSTLAAAQPGNIIARGGLASARSLATARAGAEIVFFETRTWHRTIQQTVFYALTEKRVGCVISSNIWLMLALRPKVVVLSDPPPKLIQSIRYALPETRIVNTRHGLGDKNYAFFASSIVDYVCVSSHAVAQAQATAGCLNPESLWVTGFPQMDELFSRLLRSDMPAECAEKNILFAPTFTKGLNAGELIGADPVRALRGEADSWHVTIRPHPIMEQSHTALFAQWRDSVAKADNATFDIDYQKPPAESLLRTDVLVSDVSSLALHFLALDKPLVCLMHETTASRSPFFVPDAYETRLQLAATHVSSAAQLPAAVREALAGLQPTAIVTARRELADELFGDLRDGKAGARIAENILRLIDE
jgi:hypothetical protein